MNRFTRAVFLRYKALRQFSVALEDFNVVVGPNNSGKSTIIGAFRILSEGMRIAGARKPKFHQSIQSWGYQIPLGDLPVAAEAIFTDYDDAEPATIEFTLASKDKMRLIFPENNLCYLVSEPQGRNIWTPSQFKKVYDAPIRFVPVLGPVEHNERLYQKEAARLALLAHRASRNFRNIWYHYPTEFDEFRALVKSTWPGMDVERPQVDYSHKPPVLHMFCPEHRYPREIFWAGFGFQVWCQMLTYIVRARDASLLVIDEPDIYLHSNLQRQLVEILKNCTPDVLLATHSTEIISEADPGDLLVVDKKKLSASRIRSHLQLPPIFEVLGSRLNPTLTQLAKSRRIVFVEGKDFKLLSAFSRKLGNQAIANQSDFAVISVGGFNPTRIRDLSSGIEATLGVKVLKAIILDRDFRSDEEIERQLLAIRKFASLVHIHECKEVENYLLVPSAIQRAVARRVQKRAIRSGLPVQTCDDIEEILITLSDNMKSKINAQFISKRGQFLRKANPKLDLATITEKTLEHLASVWRNLDGRLRIVPGKKLLAALNEELQDRCSVTVTPSSIVRVMRKDEIPESMRSLLSSLDDFRKAPVPGGG